MRSIQFIGTQRSGSNLLRVMLHQHPLICAPHPPHFLHILLPLVSMYGDVKDDANFYSMIDDACTLAETNPVSWNLVFDRDEVRSRVRVRTLADVARVLYEIKAEAKGSGYWCCKSMANVHYIDKLGEAGIRPFFIYIFRDGRDVALSFRGTVIGEKHVYHLAQQWKKEQELSLDICAAAGPGNSAIVRYEEFISGPEAALKNICARIDVAYDPRMLAFNESDESKETAASGGMWSNVAKPVIRSNAGKFRSGLSAEDIRIFESVAGDMLGRLGYTPEFPAEERRSFTENEMFFFTEENRRMKREAKQNASPSDIAHREKQETFIASLKEKYTNYVNTLA
ncbi:MAG TPA: sulfotransferase [Bacteroidia bacterium]|nr:sulfotransferase [Bacteroidia bacterium]